MTDIKKLLENVACGKTSVDDALLKLKIQPFEDLGFAKLDHHRKIRQGAGEVIFGASKTPEQITKIASALLKGGEPCVLITRLSHKAADFITSEFIDKKIPFHYNEISKIGVVGKKPSITSTTKIAIVTGGTSDISVAEEAALTAEFFGNQVTRIYDVGVSGLHRLLSQLENLMSARVVITIAGMEGALASVVGGLVDCPVIAVPTSVGYGASFSGLAALLSMLNSCASGVSVVNIDNGFGAGYLASMINKM